MQNNPLTEVGSIVLASLLVIGGVALLFVGKIDIAFASSMFILAAGLLGFTGALKAPSVSQQQQISTQQNQIGQLAANQQQLTGQVLSVLPQVVSATQSQPQPQPVAQPSQPVPPMPLQVQQQPFPNATGRFPAPQM